MRVGIALGSNLGGRLASLQKARQLLKEMPGAIEPLLSSAVYATDPVGCEPGAGEFLNAVIELGYEGDPRKLLEQLKAIETALGRPADHPRNNSRAIDVDLLYAGALEVQDENLQLPHPRMHQRSFVLEPLAELHPDLVLPGQQKPVNELLALLGAKAKVRRLTKDW